MSGQAGGRGYLIQALISVLDAVADDTAWLTMEVEPNLSTDKVDVIWHYSGRTKVVQIKSSQNQISVPDVRGWAIDLKASVTADEYEIRLIGPVSAAVAETNVQDSVRIPTPQPLHLDALLHQAAHKLDGYLRAKGLPVLAPLAREVLVQALVTKLAAYATNGTPIDRATFDATLRSWITEVQQASGREASGPGVVHDLVREKSNVYIEAGELLGLLGKEIEIINDWTTRIKVDDELAELCAHFPASGVVGRLRTILAGIEQCRIRWGWLMAWKVNALLFATHLKGTEVLTAVERYGREITDWELKRGHQLATSSISKVVSTYISMCYSEISADISEHARPVDNTPTDEEFRTFSRQLGDVAREESKAFSDVHPELAERLRDANRSVGDENTAAFKYRLLTERLLDPLGSQNFSLTPGQRISFLDRLYKECLGFFFRMWNEPLPPTEEEREFLRLDRLLGTQSTVEINAAFGEMIASIKRTCETSTPINRREFANWAEYETARLAILKPSAEKYRAFEQVVQAHLQELREFLQKRRN